MPKQMKEKSSHLQELEAVFDRHTRRFSPFAVLGLSSSEQDESDTSLINESGETSLLEEGLDTRAVEVQEKITPNTVPQGSGYPSTHTGVGTIHTCDPHPPMGVGGTPLPGDKIHTRVVEVKEKTTTNTVPQGGGYPPTHTGVDSTHTCDPLSLVKEDSVALSTQKTPPDSIRTQDIVLQGDGYPPTYMGVDSTHPPTYPVYTDMQMQDILIATQLKAQLGKKAREVLRYLNSIRSLERPAYTVPVGYAHISAAAAVHSHYLRRNVLPKLAMIGLIGIVHKSLQGTIYHLHYDASFLNMVVGQDEEPLPRSTLAVSPPIPLLTPSAPEESFFTLPPWIDREHWAWLTPEIIRQLVIKAGSEIQAQEKLELIVYNETHGPVERRVRDRRSVLSYYLRTPQADIWPNDDGFETLALRRSREERDRALQEKVLAEEALRVRQEAAKIRFLTLLDDGQLLWLKQEAKRRVDMQPEARFLTSRYLLYKAEEEQLVLEWMDRVAYGESVPQVNPER